MKRVAEYALLVVIAAGCLKQEELTPTPRDAMLLVGVLQELSSPASLNSGQPFLSTAPDGSVLMSWLERGDSRTHALKFARFRDGAWSPSQTIAERSDFFVNWADFPAVVETGNQHLFAAWLQKSGASTYAYDVRVASSQDGGKSWGASMVPHRDGTRTEHGFVSLVPAGESVAAVWLDGRNMTEGHGHGASGSMTLRYARITPRGELLNEALLDERACECCQTGMAVGNKGAVVVYRDRSESEVRDIGVIRADGNSWTAPQALAEDGWKIEGCPVNGPQIDARGERMVVAWFTSGGGRNRVKAAFSADGGATFAAPVDMAAESPIGRTDVALLEDGSALVSWIERVGESAEVRMRRVFADGRLESPLKVATSSPARSAGVPRITLGTDAIYIAWTEPGTPSRIRVSMLPLERG